MELHRQLLSFKNHRAGNQNEPRMVPLFFSTMDLLKIIFKLYEYNRAIDLAETFQTLAASQAQFHEEMANSYRGATSVDLGE